MSQRKSRYRDATQASQSFLADKDEADFSQSQKSQVPGLSPEEENRLVASVIRYLLAADRAKTIVQRQHLIKNVLKDYAKYYRKIIDVVTKTLQEVFGLNLEEFEPTKYILVNTIPNNIPHLLTPTDDQPCRILLVLVLTHIFMMDDECKEELLWDFLRSLTVITEDNFYNEYFGDVRRKITIDFVKQRYLDMSKVESSDPPTFTFQWGSRADEEMSKRLVLEFVSKMYNNRPITTWQSQYNELTAAERQDLEQGDNNRREENDTIL